MVGGAVVKKESIEVLKCCCLLFVVVVRRCCVGRRPLYRLIGWVVAEEAFKHSFLPSFVATNKVVVVLLLVRCRHCDGDEQRYGSATFDACGWVLRVCAVCNRARVVEVSVWYCVLCGSFVATTTLLL